MTNGTSQGLFIVIAIVIFGIFVGLSQTLFGKQLTNDLVAIFDQATEQAEFKGDQDYNVEDVIPNAESDFIFDGVNKIIGYKGSSTEVVIPKTINNKTVTSISGDAFNDKNITKIIMPNSITTIEDGSIVIEPQVVASTYSFSASGNTSKVVGAFANNDIQELSVSANIKYIGSFAFFNGELDDVILPEGLKSIGEGSFEQDNLSEINIPSTVENIGDNAFKDNILKDVNYAKGSLLKNMGEGVFSGNDLNAVVIPKGVSKIPDNAYSNSGLKDVTIPEGITSIGDNAFSNNELTSVKIPESVTNIGKESFSNNNLVDVTIPKNVKEIGEGSFKENDLAKVELYEGLERIGDYAFYKNQLPVIDLPNSLLSIGKYAFYSNKLSFVEIPNKLSVIREWTFAYNQLPSKPEIPSNIEKEEENAFYGNLFIDGNIVPDDVSFVFENNIIETAVKKALGVGDRKLTGADLKKVTTLDLSNKGLTSIDGLQYLPNLINLNLDNNKLTTLDKPTNPMLRTASKTSYLSELTKISKISLINNKVTNLESLRDLKTLNTLDASNNLITTMNLTTGFTNLTTGHLSGNPLDAATLNVVKLLPKWKFDTAVSTYTSVTSGYFIDGGAYRYNDRWYFYGGKTKSEYEKTGYLLESNGNDVTLLLAIVSINLTDADGIQSVTINNVNFYKDDSASLKTVKVGTTDATKKTHGIYTKNRTQSVHNVVIVDGVGNRTTLTFKIQAGR